MDDEKLQKIIEVENNLFRKYYDEDGSSNNNHINDTIKTTICLNTIENLKFKYLVSIRSIVKEVEDIKKQFKIENDDVVDTIYLKRYSKKEFLSNVLDAIMDDDLNPSTSYGFLLFIMIEMNILEDYTLFDTFNTKTMKINDEIQEDTYISYTKSFLSVLNAVTNCIHLINNKCDDEIKCDESINLVYNSRFLDYHIDNENYNKTLLKGLEHFNELDFYANIELEPIYTPLKALDLIHRTLSFFLCSLASENNAKYYDGFSKHFMGLMENPDSFKNTPPYLLNFSKYLFKYLENYKTTYQI